MTVDPTPDPIGSDGPKAFGAWADQLGVEQDAVHNAVIALGPDSGAMVSRLKWARVFAG